MANPHKGEVSFEAGGKTRTLRMGTNEQCELEAEYDLGIMRILAHLDLGRMTDIRRIFRACLVGGATIEEASEIIDDIGGYLEVMDLLEKTVRLAFPRAAEAANGTSPPPMTAEPLIGIDSSSNGSPPAVLKTRSGRALSAK
jgi:hypothetical protein